MEKESFFWGTGRRKTATAQVRLTPGDGTITVDDKPLEERFPRFEQRQVITKPLQVTENLGKFNVVAKVDGGGISGQSGAISHGIARALVMANEAFKPLLRQYGLLTRDSRAKERKKAGLRRARKAPQYTKR
ncbi:MAG: 30S ribosomal protein S9 [Chloroflexi bacterium]|nr:30S ribosomal protein S9 [Chloroflexota bacterium]